MKIKNGLKNLALLLSALLMAGACAAPTPQNGEISESPSASVTAETSVPETDVTDTSVPETNVTDTSATISETEQTIREEASAEEKTGPAEAQPAQKYIDENGLLNDAAKERIDALLAENPPTDGYVYPGLFDFDRDGVPELYLVLHSNGQGFMLTVVVTLDGERLGEFEGYCRDGFCRFSVGEDCVYVHNKYEHSMHYSVDLVTRLTVEDGVLSSEEVLCQIGDVLDGESFPLKYYSYFVNGESAEKEAFDGAYNSWLREKDYPSTREANEVSICTYDLLFSNLPFSELPDDNERGEAVVSLYNRYVAGKNAATERFGSEKLVFAFDDYDKDGTYEAFVQPQREDGFPTDSLYFWNGAEFTKLDPDPYGGFYHYTRIGDLFFAESIGNGSLCSIYGVRDGEYYKHENSLRGMIFIPTENYVNEEFMLYDSTFELHHTHKPYFFTYPCEEIVAEPVTEADFSDREDVLAVLDELKAELSVYPENAEIVGMYLRGGEYLHVNYYEPVEAHDEEGNTHYFPLPHYRTYIVQNKAVQIDAGDGHYRASLCGEDE